MPRKTDRQMAFEGYSSHSGHDRGFVLAEVIRVLHLPKLNISWMEMSRVLYQPFPSHVIQTFGVSLTCGVVHSHSFPSFRYLPRRSNSNLKTAGAGTFVRNTNEIYILRAFFTVITGTRFPSVMKRNCPANSFFILQTDLNMKLQRLILCLRRLRVKAEVATRIFTEF